MARDARQRKVPEPEPSALAHRALRARLASAEGVAALPGRWSPRSRPSSPRRRGRPGRRPDATSAAGRPRTPRTRRRPIARRPAEIRKAMDRRLWADARQRLMEGEPIADLSAAVDAGRPGGRGAPRAGRPAGPPAGEGHRRGPPRARHPPAGRGPAPGRGLPASGCDAPTTPGRSSATGWSSKKSRLSETDAEGRVALAGLYEEMIQDRVTAVDLLRKAWEIDPSSRETAEAFRTPGFPPREGRLGRGGRPRAGRPGRRRAGCGARRPSPTPPSLLGLTPDELERKLIVKPSYKNYVGSRGPAHRAAGLS